MGDQPTEQDGQVNPYLTMPDAELFSKDPLATTPADQDEIARRMAERVAKFREMREKHFEKKAESDAKEKKPRKAPKKLKENITLSQVP